MAELELLKQVIEVAVFAALIYLVLRFLRETRGSGVVRGLAFLLIVGVVTFVVLIQAMALHRLERLFQTIAQSVVIALVIVFHPEIRRAIVHLGDSPIFGRFFQKESKIVQRVLRAVARMSKERIGALIAVEREASLQSLAESGVTIDAELNSFLIESIFYPKSALHDGAIVVRDDRIVAASCLLPLSQNPDVDKRLGTRHRAALGLSEETDALAIVVSEETGKVSVAQGGKLSFDLTLEQIERAMDEALGVRQRSSGRRSKSAGRSLWSALTADPVRKLAAVALGIGLWYFLDRQITDVHEVDMQLGVVAIGEKPSQDGISELAVSLPTDRVAATGFVDQSTNQPVESVKITFRGPKNTIETLRDESLKLTVSLPNVEWDTVDGADFNARDIATSTHRALFDGTVKIDMAPPRIRIHVVRVSEERLQLSPEWIELSFGGDEQLKARIRPETIEFQPKVIKLSGRREAHEAFRARQGERPLRAVLTARANERRVSAPIQLRPEFRQLGLELGEPCSVSVELRPVMDVYALTLPVLVDDRSLPAELQGQYRPDTPFKEVRVKVGGALRSRLVGFDDESRRRWARDHLRLLVWIRPLEDGAAYPQKFPALARLFNPGATGELDNSAEMGLDETVSVDLHREP